MKKQATSKTSVEQRLANAETLIDTMQRNNATLHSHMADAIRGFEARMDAIEKVDRDAQRALRLVEVELVALREAMRTIAVSLAVS